MSFGAPLRHFETIESTNDAAMAWARAGAPHGAVVTAGAQTQGRGRRGRDWSSPPGKGLYLSLILRPALEPHQVPKLTMIAALAVARCVAARTGLAAQVKWPNDVLLRGRKIGGILSEAELHNTQHDFIVIGIGLNANFEASDLPPRPQFPASSLLLETGRAWTVEEMVQSCLTEIEALYHAYMDGNWDRLREEFSAHCAGLGLPVTVSLENEIFSGVASRLDEDGTLIVATATGLRRVVSGDVQY